MRLGRRVRSVVTGLLEASAFLTAVFSVATAFDFLHPYLELFAHFRLQYFVASLLLAAALALLRRPLYVILMLVISIVNAAYVVPWYTGGERSEGGPVVTILLANVLSVNHDLDRLREQIRIEQPDVILLQELTSAHLAELAPIAKEYPHHVIETREDNFGIGAWSRIPLQRGAVIDTPPRGYPSVALTLEFGPDLLSILSTHPIPPLGQANYADRNEQLSHIGDLVIAAPGSVAIIGDLNTTMWGSTYRSFRKRTGLRDARQGHGILPSWPLFMPFAMIPIDHALLSPDLVATDVRTLPPIGSDHLPLLVRIGRR